MVGENVTQVTLSVCPRKVLGTKTHSPIRTSAVNLQPMCRYFQNKTKHAAYRSRTGSASVMRVFRSTNQRISHQSKFSQACLKPSLAPFQAMIPRTRRGSKESSGAVEQSVARNSPPRRSGSHLTPARLRNVNGSPIGTSPARYKPERYPYRASHGTNMRLRGVAN
jgi:hypothetical protein